MKSCPKHAAVLTEKTLNGVAARYCEHCSGLWLPSSVVEAALGKVAKPAYLHRSGNPTSLRCPDDGSSLVALHYHGVEVDLCMACGGVWLDHGELERILKRRRRGYGSADAVVEAASNADGVLGAGDLAADAIAGVMEFLGELFSGV